MKWEWKNEIGTDLTADRVQRTEEYDLWSWDDNPVGQLCADHFKSFWHQPFETKPVPYIWKYSKFYQVFLLQFGWLVE